MGRGAARRPVVAMLLGTATLVFRARSPSWIGPRCGTSAVQQGSRAGRLASSQRIETRFEKGAFGVSTRIRRAAGVGRAAEGVGGEDGESVFVSVVAFADPELPVTLRSLLTQALHPERLYVGLVWQGFDGEEPLTPDDLAELSRLWNVPNDGEKPYDSPAISEIFGGALPLPAGREYSLTELAGGHIRLLKFKAEDARGPCWARYLAQHLWSGEDFYMQVDSHMRFVPHWDVQMQEQLAWCARRSEKPVLSTYGRGYKLGTPPDWDPAEAESTPSLICAGFFDSNNVLNIRSRPLKRTLEHPRRNPFWSGHFSFSSSRLLREVPYDPQCLMLLFGEEPLMAVRLFTHGWDIYTPSRGLLFHLWERDYRRTFFEMKDLYAKLLPRTLRRVFWLLDAGPQPPAGEQQAGWPLPGGLPPTEQAASTADDFGLGSVRTLAEYERMADVSFQQRHIGASALRAGLPKEDNPFLVSEAAAPPPPDFESQLIFFSICLLPIVINVVLWVQAKVST